jgi:hypothetical protein
MMTTLGSTPFEQNGDSKHILDGQNPILVRDNTPRRALIIGNLIPKMELFIPCEPYHFCVTQTQTSVPAKMLDRIKSEPANHTSCISAILIPRHS